MFLRRAQTVFPLSYWSHFRSEEARFILPGRSLILNIIRGRRLVMDIGGGSIEFAIGKGFQPLN